MQYLAELPSIETYVKFQCCLVELNVDETVRFYLSNSGDSIPIT